MTLTSVRAAPRLSTAALALIGWAVLASIVLFHALHMPGDVFLSTDDAMRLAQLRDLAHGQSWFDTVQPRMNAPFGLTMHWPHYVDGALLLLVDLLRPVAGGQAETWALWLWPLLTALPVVLALAQLGERLAGREGAILTVALTATCLSVFALFGPDQIDHHNVQLGLTLWMAVGLTRPERPGQLVLAALTGMSSLAIGLETLPYVLTVALFVTGLGVIEPARFDRAMRAYGLAFAASAVVFFALAPQDARTVPVCDAFSGFYAAIAVLGGLGLVALSVAPRRIALRAGGIVLLSAAILALGDAVNPVCLAGPYGAVDPALKAVWLSRIQEAQPISAMIRSWPAFFVASYLYAVLGVAASVAMCLLAKERRLGFVGTALLALAALALASYEVRGTPFAELLGLPGLAALLLLGLRRIETMPGHPALRALLTMVVLFLGCNAGFTMAANDVQATATGSAIVPGAKARLCLDPQALAALDTLPKGNVAAFIDQGPAILVATGDSVIAGPYHRGAAAILDTNTVFSGPLAQSQAILSARRIDYVVACSVSPDWRFYAGKNPQGLMARLARGRTPAWLAPVHLPAAPDAIRVWRVRGPLSPQP